MLLNPIAAQKLKAATAYGDYPYTTHAQRNELARMFHEEAGKLLDQQAESLIKHAVEQYAQGEISYERYMELIEEVSKEEEARGVTYGKQYARNNVFEFAEKRLDHAENQAYTLSLTEAKKQYEVEKQKTEQRLKEVVQEYLSEVQTITKQQQAELQTVTQEQKDELVLNQTAIIKQTQVTIGEILSLQLQEERKKREQEIREEEALRPAREAAHAATARVAAREKQLHTHQRIKSGLIALGAVLLAALLVLLLFLAIPQWGTAIAIAVIASVLLVAVLWRSPISREDIAAHQKEIALFQTQSGDYASLAEEERCTLLVQRIG